MERYKCSRCGYIYDPAVGRPEMGTKAGIKFNDLPDEWTCPECGTEKHSWPPWVKLDTPKTPSKK